MRRVTVAYEGRATGDGRFIQAGALTWERQPVPLMVMPPESDPGHEGARLIGTVRNFEREADGRITADIEPVIPGLAPEIDLDHMQVEIVDEVMQVTSGRIASVVLGNRPCWDGMVIE